ncbi:hypothetical protein JXL21_07510 [Candidatus Bathyarchaeota archaeon]|nr:hypothetical protein [Candidatus Bathyarchaeota archaeon]
MNPKKKLPDGSEEIERKGEYILVKHSLDGQPYYSIFLFYESSKGTLYVPRGGGGRDLDQVKQQLDRITRAKRLVKAP